MKEDRKKKRAVTITEATAYLNPTIWGWEADVPQWAGSGPHPHEWRGSIEETSKLLDNKNEP